MSRRGEALRAEVLDALRRKDRPQSAYAILDLLRQSNPKTAPMTVYRALNTLAEQGHVHRLESINSYVLCKNHAEGNQAILSICDDCGGVEENVAPDVHTTMDKIVGKSGFAPTRHVVEVHGTCADCAEERPTS